MISSCWVNAITISGRGGGKGGEGASEQLGTSFGSITPLFPMKVVGGHAHSSGRKSLVSLVPRVTKVNFLPTV